MKLTVVGSSSRGNCYILSNLGECLIIEAGCSITDIMKAIDYKTSKVSACIVSHEHKDHSKSVAKLQKYGIKCYMSEGTYNGIEGLQIKPEIVTALEQFEVGRFTIMPFDVHHDSAQPLGYLISHPEIGTLLFAIDTCYLPYTFSDLTNVMIECNYSEDLLEANVEAGIVHPVVRRHVSRAHMSLQTCIKALKANDLSKVNNIVLMHLSKDNGDAIRFQEEVRLSTGKRVFVAEKGLMIDINKNPYSYD